MVNRASVPLVKRLGYFILLTRPINLAIIVLTMYLIRYGLLKPLLHYHGQTLVMPYYYFLLLVFSVTLIAAAGNIINDYFDIKTDSINKPNAVIVGYKIKRREAIASHLVITSVGVLLGIYVSFKTGLPALSILFILSASALWFYSTTYKKSFLVGNIIIALLTGLVPLMVALFEIPQVAKIFGAQMALELADLPDYTPFDYFLLLFYWVLGFAVFSMLANLAREIQKDIADIEGDKEIKASTLPIMLGERKSKLIVLILHLFMIIALFAVQRYILTDRITFWYLLLAVQLPMLISALYTIIANTRPKMMVAANILKIAMAGGLFYTLVAGYLLNNQMI
ncbi:MAG: geranylgeranylglycerol-phosphate geranylgeranyltransferase [Luteibaculaceae bacterium]